MILTRKRLLSSGYISHSQIIKITRLASASLRALISSQ